MTDQSASQRDQIDELAESFVARFRAGERPSIEEYARKYPELADELRELLPALVMLEQQGSLEDTAGLGGATAPRPAPRELGDFTIVREIGRGGMGVVYEAVQQSLGRHVALKVLSSPGLMNPVHLERFRLEARSAGRLHHSHIVPVFGVGEHQGLHYYAMQFIAGQSLDQVIEALRKLRPGEDPEKTAPLAQDDFTHSLANGLLTGRFRTDEAAAGNGAAGPSEAERQSGASDCIAPPATPQPTTSSFASHSEFTSSSSGRPFYDSVARVGLQVAEALAYAHAEGVLHRDIKPSNLLLDAKGNTWVTDFGLAKAEENEALTETGDFVGTLRYMAPERLEGWSDRRSDIYGLGATLYELLTLRPFFESSRRAQLIDDIRHAQPRPPTKIDAAIPRDLETIVLKALSKEPASRYHTAEEMADDLRRFLSDRPILARRSTARERFVRWCRRNPLVASLALTVAALLTGAVAILAVSNVQIRRESQEKAIALRDRDKALILAQEKESLARSRFYAAQMNLAVRALNDGQVARTVGLLESLRPRDNERDPRGFEWHYLHHLSHPNLLHTWQAHSVMVTDIAWSPDSAVFATCGLGDAVRLWDGRTGDHRCDLLGHGAAFRLAYSPDGNRLAVATRDLRAPVVVWDVVARRILWRCENQPGCEAVAFSVDGQTIATGSFGEIKLWGAARGNLFATLKGHAVDELAFSPDGKMLASATTWYDPQKSVILWDFDATSANKRWEAEQVGGQMVFSADSQTLFAGPRRIDVASGKFGDPIPGLADRGGDVCLFAQRNQLIASPGDRTLRAWDLATGQSSVFGAELAPVVAMAIDPKGESIACGDERGWASLRRLEPPKSPSEFHDSRSIGAVAFTPDGNSLIVAGWPVCRLDGTTLELRSISPRGAQAISTANGLAATYDDKNQRCTIWNMNSDWDGPSFDVGTIDRARFSPDGNLLATWRTWSSPILELWNTETGGRVERKVGNWISVVDLAFSPTTQHLAASRQFHEIAVLDLDGKKWDSYGFANGHQSATAITYSAQGDTLAAGLHDGDVLLFDVDHQSGGLKLRSQWNGHALNVVAIAFSHDGRSLVTAGADGAVRFWDVATGQERVTLDMSAKLLTFSPDGSRLAVVEENDTVRVLVGSDRFSVRSKVIAMRLFFLAMAHWQLDHKDEARKWYDKSVEWMEKNQPRNEELIRFRAEAEQLLGITEPSPTPKDAPQGDDAATPKSYSPQARQSRAH